MDDEAIFIEMLAKVELLVEPCLKVKAKKHNL